ncbi:MAG: molybdenum cofactor biosynthesis protein MoaE [Oligoflexia bacterium]|nr:molybdenum cofactor biosynthesis protein MoaE [Oligoflexia bacterium]
MKNNIECKIVESKVSETEIFQKVHRPENGGMNFFFGSVRDFNADKKVIAVSYDSFEPLAIKVLEEISKEAIVKWGDSLNIYVVHRVGRLKCGEISVGVGVSSRHRDESYQASRYIIEQLKNRVPIWKKETYENGETAWLRGHALCSHAKEHVRNYEHR